MFGASNNNCMQVGYTMGMHDVPYAGGQPLMMQVDVNVHLQVNGVNVAAPAGAPINPAGFAEALDVVLHGPPAPAPPNQMMIDDGDVDTDWNLAENQQVMIRDVFEEPDPPGPNARNGEWADYCYLYFQLHPDDRYIYSRADWLQWLNVHWPHLHDQQ